MRDLLRLRGLRQHDIDEWVSDCGHPCKAAIRKMLCGESRRAFDAAQDGRAIAHPRGGMGPSRTILGSRAAYLVPVEAPAGEDEHFQRPRRIQGPCSKSRPGLSNRFARGRADFRMANVYQCIVLGVRPSGKRSGLESLQHLAMPLHIPAPSAILRASSNSSAARLQERHEEPLDALADQPPSS